MINLVNDLYLDADPLQFILKKKTIVQDKKSKNYGNENFIVVGYYPDLGTLAKQTIMYAVKQEDFDSIKAMEKRLNELIKEVKVNINRVDFEKLQKVL